MKVTNWRAKLASALVAGGLFVPAATDAADLNTNLIANPGFENVDTADTGPFTSVRLLDWIDADGDDDDNFAYPYSSNYSGMPAPPSSGAYHFSGGFNTADGAVLVSQSIDVSTGATGAAIASGLATYNLSGFFSSYLDQDDASSIRVRFLDGAATELATAEIGGLAFLQSLPLPAGQRDWGQDATTGMVPVGTSSVALEVISSDADPNHDGYVDLVSFSISQVPEPTSIVLVGLAFTAGALVMSRRRERGNERATFWSA
jgi:hypothetical protein